MNTPIEPRRSLPALIRLLRIAPALAAIVLAAPAAARDDLQAEPVEARQEAAVSTPAPPPYIRAHEANGELQAVVMGDSMADGMYAGLYRIMKDEPRLKFVKKTKVNTGIVRSDRYDWNEAARQIAGESAYDIAILVFGANDLQSIRANGKAYHFRQPGWEEQFNRRIDDMVTALKAENIAAYWIGLPITRKDKFQKDYAYLNGLFRAAAKRNGIRYVETWDAFADENGEFSAYGIGINGKKTQLRADDGVHFTPDGYAVYASVVADVLRTDVAAAEAALAAKSASHTE